MSQSENVKGVADILFLIDATGSMRDCIEALKENIAIFVEAMVADPQSPIRDWRAAAWGYRDAEVDGSNWLVKTPFVSTAAELRAQFARLEAKGGGDEPESLLDALYKVATIGNSEKGGSADPNRWRYPSAAARVMVVFTDATFKPVMVIPEAAGAGVDDAVHAVMGAGITSVFYAPAFPCFDTLSVMDKAEFEQICAADHPKPPEALSAYTQDRANFIKTMKALAKTVIASAPVPELT